MNHDCRSTEEHLLLLVLLRHPVPDCVSVGPVTPLATCTCSSPARASAFRFRLEAFIQRHKTRHFFTSGNSLALALLMRNVLSFSLRGSSRPYISPFARQSPKAFI